MQICVILQREKSRESNQDIKSHTTYGGKKKEEVYISSRKTFSERQGRYDYQGIHSCHR